MVSANTSEGMKLNIDKLLWPENSLNGIVKEIFILYFCNGDIMKAWHNIHGLFLISNR